MRKDYDSDFIKTGLKHERLRTWEDVMQVEVPEDFRLGQLIRRLQTAEVAARYKNPSLLDAHVEPETGSLYLLFGGKETT